MLTLFFASFSLSSLKVSDINVRLPFRLPGNRPPRYTITASDSSVTWESTDPQKVKILPNPKTNRGESSITVEVLYQGPHSEAVPIRAKTREESTEVIVYIDQIYSAIISTTSRVLYAGDSIDRFKITAYDKHENTFSSIDSYSIDWIFNSTEIRRVNLNETDLLTKYKDGLPENEILIQGRLVGKRKLSAVINKQVQVPEIKLTIVEPIHLIPSVHFMLPGSTFKAKLCTRNKENSFGIFSNSRCNKEIKVPEKKYVFISDNETTATVEQDATITAHEIGTTSIRVEDQIMPLNKVSMSVHVVRPLKIEIPEQWILLGQEPSFEQATLYNYDNTPLEKPERIDWHFSDEYKSVGTHKITATAFGTSTTFVVHTCEQLRFDPNTITLPVHHKGYKPVLLGGSGFIQFSESNRKVFRYESKLISAGDVGVATLTARDEKLGIEAVLTVNVEEMVRPRFDFPVREFLEGEQINYTFSTTTRSGQPFTFIEGFSISSNDQSVVSDRNNELTAASEGFANITCTITGYTQTVLIGVFRHVQIQTIVNVNTGEDYDLSKTYGPLQWPHSAPPSATVTCGRARATITNNTILKLRDKYSGVCEFSIQNPQTELNPRPRVDTIEFTIRAEKIVDIVITVEDEKSINDPESGLAASHVDPFAARSMTHVAIPSIHNCFIQIYAFSRDENDELQLLGEYKHPQMQLLDQHGNSFVNGSFLTEVTTLTLTPPPSVEIAPKTFTITPVFNISTTSSVSIYQYAQQGSQVTIHNGTGHYVIESGTHANLTGDTLTIFPAQEEREMKRHIVVRDRFVPEYRATILVLTEEPAKLQITGVDFCINNQDVEYTVTVYSQNGNEIAADTLKFETDVPRLEQVASDPSKWIYHASYIGQVNIIISTQGITGSKMLTVLDQIKFVPEELTLYEGESFKPLVIGGNGNEQLEFEYENSSVANFDERNIIRAVNPGRTEITATVPSKPMLGVAKISVRVLGIYDVKIVQFPEQPYVDSYIRLTPVLETSDGDQPPRSVSWDIRGSDSWEKLYDGAVMIRADRAGQIIAKVSAHDHNRTVIIDVDPRLELKSPAKLSLPTGANYTLELKTQIPGTSFSVTALTGSQSGLSVSESGFLTAQAEGEYVVVARFKSQVVGAVVKVSTPAQVYLQLEGATSVRPILLDSDGQEYTTQNGASFAFNVTNSFITDAKGKYAFSIDAPTYIQVTASNTFFTLTNTTLLSHTLISPDSPIVLKGVKTEFKCSAKRPNWNSASPSVAITQDGIATALKRGRATVFCTEQIHTQLTVAEINSIELHELDEMKEYAITPVFQSDKFDASQVVYPNDLQVTCTWNAPECGRVYASNPSSLNGTRCIIEMYKARKCPSHIRLEAHVTSLSGDLQNVVGSYNIDYGSVIWGLPSEVNVSVSRKRPSIDIPIVPKPNEVRIISGAVGLRPVLSDKGLTITADFDNFRDRGTIQLEYIGNNNTDSRQKHIGEQLQINVFERDYTGIDVELPRNRTFLDRLLFNISIILTCVFGFYAAYMLGQSGNLPAFSPYKGTATKK